MAFVGHVLAFVCFPGFSFHGFRFWCYDLIKWYLLILVILPVFDR